MTWAPLLMADPSPCLRWRVLREIYHKSADNSELLELDALRIQDIQVVEILAMQDADGSFKPGTLAEGKFGYNRTLITAFTLARLAFLGFDRSFLPVAKAAEFLFSQQKEDGSWVLHADGVAEEEPAVPKIREGYAMIPLQTALPLRGLAACGYAEDQRCEKAYEWLLAQQLPDGAWPTGLARSGVYGYVGGYRRLPHSRWGCRSNTTGALICLSCHPGRRSSDVAHRALDHLLARETRETHTLGFETARLVGAEPAHGFFTFFARFDLALILDLCGRIGAGKSDPRVSDLLAFFNSLQNEHRLWEYPAHPEVSRWVTLGLMNSISRIDEGVDWINLEPRTPFQAYPKKSRRY